MFAKLPKPVRFTLRCMGKLSTIVWVPLACVLFALCMIVEETIIFYRKS